MFRIIKTKFVILFFLVFCHALANADKGPQYRSLRVHGMGGAFVALADGREALYYNPAGLNLKSRFENFKKYPEMAYMPRQRYEFRLLTASIWFPEDEIDYVLDVCGGPKFGTIIKKLVFLNFSYFRRSNLENIACPSYKDELPDDIEDWPQYFQDNPDLLNNFRKLDSDPIEIGTQVSVLEFSTHNFGFALWANTSAAPYFDYGIVPPIGGYEATNIDAVAQTGFAFSPVDNWSVGMGLKAARRHKEIGYRYLTNLDLDTISEPKIRNEYVRDSLSDYLETVKDSLKRRDFDDIKFALDFGLLYQLTREVRLGGSLRNVFFSELAGESITPNLSIGAAYSPMILQSNSWWARKVNIAADYVDIIDGTVGDMFFAHLNFGAEIEQVVLPSPSRNLSFWPRFGIALLGGLAGAGLGYKIGPLIGGKDYEMPGWIAGLSFGSLAGLNIGFGGDVLRTSFGLGRESGYSAWNVGLAFTDALQVRFGSHAEERGLRTGQMKQRFWTGELSIGF